MKLELFLNSLCTDCLVCALESIFPAFILATTSRLWRASFTALTSSTPAYLLPVFALDLWTTTVTLTPAAGSHLGEIGEHLYRYELWWTPPGGTQQCVCPWIVDPFAREAEMGRMSAFTLDPAPVPFTWTDDAWKTPELDDLVVYELQVEEFNDTFDGVIDRLTYLVSLGVNCIELMPVTSMQLDFDWGYGPFRAQLALRRQCRTEAPG